MVSETPATARLSHVGHRRAPTLSNQIAGKDGQTCRGLGGSGLLLPASWEVTGIRTCWRGGGGGGGSSSRARHTYLHSLGAHAAPRAAPPAETRPGPAGAAAAASQRRRALGHLAAKFRPRRSPRRLAPRPPPQRGRRPTRARPALSARRLRGRQKRVRGAAHLPAPPAAPPRPALRGPAGGGRSAGRAGASGLRGPGRRRLQRAVMRGPRRVLQRRCPSLRPDVLILLQQILQPAPRRPLAERRLLAVRPGLPSRGLLAAAAMGTLGSAGRRVRVACPELAGLVSVLLPQPSPEHCARVSRSCACVCV